MDLAKDELKEFKRAEILIKGNALAYGNKIYQITNIVKMEFDSVKKRKEKFSRISDSFRKFKKSLLRSMIGFISIAIVISLSSANKLPMSNEMVTIFGNYISYSDILGVTLVIIGLISISFIASAIAYLLITIISLIYYQFNKHYYIYGLHIQLVTGERIMFISRYNGQFIRDTIDSLYKVLSGTNSSHLTINFSTQEAYFAKEIDKSSIEVKQSENTNIIKDSDNTNVTGGENSGVMSNTISNK